MPNTTSLKGVLFDLDGVITRTVDMHIHAWEKVFNDVLQQHKNSLATTTKPQEAPDSPNAFPSTRTTSEEATTDRWRPFTRLDYIRYVDGRPRYDGVRSFLASRSLRVQEGIPTDTPDMQTVCGIGNRKNAEFIASIGRDGVDVYTSTVQLMYGCLSRGMKVGVVSSSMNCRLMMDRLDLTKKVHTIVDGIVATEHKLRGKPYPDTYLRACFGLGLLPAECVVLEDSLSGVRSAVNGGFGLVLGIARDHNEVPLRTSGADVVVRDLQGYDVMDLERWFADTASWRRHNSRTRSKI